MCGVRLVAAFLESECQVEQGRLWLTGPQPDPAKRRSGLLDQGQHEGPAHALAPGVRRHIHVADTAHRGIVEVRVPVQPTDANELGAQSRLQGDLTGPVEAIGTIVPFIDETPHQVVTFSETFLEQRRDIVGQRGHGFYREAICHHVANRMAGMNRVVVVGSSGSGKTTVARRLASVLDAPFLEMDSVFHRYGWADDPPDDFLPTLDDFTRPDRWVIDGNYTSHGVRDVVWPRADTFVWLDPPRRTTVSRVVRRTLRRIFTREELWGGVKEPFTNLYSRDPHKNIIVWTWTRHADTKEKFETAMADGSWQHATVHRLRTPREVESFIFYRGRRA